MIAGKVDKKLYHLIKVRASQINGCAYCIAMHTEQALRDGETAERLTMLDAWQEASIYTEKERAVLQWTEDLTRIAETRAPHESFDALKAHFSEDEVAWLTLAATMINNWNRVAISSRSQYQSPHQPSASAAKVAEPA
jgi:AhpD family alkylhydroperoxidase